MASSYSKTPLAKKLGLKEEMKVLLYHPPSYYFDLFEDLPQSLTIESSGKNNSIDFIHIFCTTYQDFQEAASLHKNYLKKTGLFWVSWPKGKSKIPTNLKRDMIREFMLKIGVVDVKVAAIDENWSGLKFVYRLQDR